MMPQRSYLAKRKAPRKGTGKKAGKPRQPNRAAQQEKVVEPLTPGGVRRETRSATNLKFRPLERAVAGDVRASDRRVKEQGDWWQNYLDTVNQGRSETQAAYNQAGATNQAQIGQASAIDTANTAQLQAEANKSAELRGAAPSTAPAEREAAMQAQRNYLAAAQGGATARAGANQFGYLTDQKRIGGGQSIASRQAEQRRGRSIRKDMRDVRRERGDYATTKRGELRKEERDYQIQRGAFGLDKAKAGLESQEAARSAGEAGRKEQLERAKFHSEARKRHSEERNTREDNERAEKSRREEKGNGGLTPAERRSRREGYQNAWQEANALYASEPPPRSPSEWAKFQSHLASVSEVSPAEAAWAVKKLKARQQRQKESKLEESYPHR